MEIYEFFENIKKKKDIQKVLIIDRKLNKTQRKARKNNMIKILFVCHGMVFTQRKTLEISGVFAPEQPIYDTFTTGKAKL